MSRARRFAVCVGLGLLALTGCSSNRVRKAQATTRSGGLTVRVRVYRSGAEAAALVGLALEGHPYYLVVDTGAARTIVDTRIARSLGLRDDGSPREFAPLGCRVSAQPAALRGWSLAGMSLPPSTVLKGSLATRAFTGLRFGGLLGADVLSRFGRVTINFTHRQLILGGKTPAGGSAVPIEVMRRAGSVLAITKVNLDKHRAWFLVDTGAGISLIDSAAAARLGLKAVGHSATLTGAVCRRSATPVLVHEWSIAGIHIPEAVIGRTQGLLPTAYLKRGIVGILGTSTMARRGTLTIDFAHSRMILGRTIH